MAISILPAETGDAATFIDVGMRAFKDDAFNRRLFDLYTATPEQIAQFRQWRIKNNIDRMQGPGKHYFKAVDEASGEIVGYTGMCAPEGFDLDATWQAAATAPDFVNPDVEKEFRPAQAAAKVKWLGDRKDVWYIQSMAVSPDYWGKGIGKKLLKRALEEVDKTGQDIFLESSPAATRLYQSCGFEELERIEMSGGMAMTAMMRRNKSV